MKRALSLIIVLAMVLCMIPFSAFAADFDTATDFVDGVITLPADEEVSYLWTATEDGTLYIYAEAVTPVDENGEVIEDASVAEPYIQVDGADYDAEVGVAVTAGESYEITFGDNAMVGGEVTVWTNFVGLPGTETNPIVLQYPLTPMYPNPTTNAIEPGVTEYYVLQGYAGQEVIISGLGVKVVTTADGEVYGGEATTESVTFTVPSNGMYYVLKITNKAEAAQTYTVTTVVKEGTMDNPQVVTDGEYTAALEAGNQGYYYSYTAEGDGTVTITVAAEGTISVTDEETGEVTETPIGWIYAVNNITSNAYGDTQWSDSDPVVNPATVEVAAGDNLIIMVGTYNAADEWNTPAGSITTTIAFEAAAVEPSTIVIESLPYTAVHSGTYEQEYSYTATEDCWLYVTTTGDSEGGFINFDSWGAEVYGDGNVYNLTAGQSVGIILSNYSWGPQDVEYTYVFSALSEIEPDGSSAFPFVIDTILPDGVTLTNDGEDAVYYSYVAEKNGEIYNGFWESATPVAAGESMNIYVPAGQSVNVYYLPPVAMIGDAEYTTIDAAVAAAVSGDTITLVANATAEAGIVLPAGANLDLGAYDLVAPYLVAFSGSTVTGDVAEASITASNMSVGNVTIADVEYAWTATDGVYTLTAAGAVANAVAKIGDKEFATVEDALNAAVSGNTVTMIGDDINNADATLIIKAGVTLDIGAFDLAALNIVGFNGGYINASTIHATKDYGTIDVENMVLGEVAPAGTSAGYSLIPLLNGDKYVFAQVLLSQAKFDIINAGDTYELEFGFGVTGAAKTAMLNNGASDNAVDVIVQASWKTENAELNQSFVYNDEFVGTASSDKKNLSASLGGILSKSDIKLFAKFVTDSGVVVSIPFENPTVVN